MAHAEFFLRHEHKYCLTEKEAEQFLSLAQGHLKEDHYPEYDLNNLYFDSDQFEMIQTCLKKPCYRQKLRMRTYGNPSIDTQFYLEIKKKYAGLGSKRRIALSSKDAERVMHGDDQCLQKDREAAEMLYLLQKYHALPKVFLAYHRLAFTDESDPGVRITIDSAIRFRDDNLDLFTRSTDCPVMNSDSRILEIKLQDSYPLWLVKILNDMHLARGSFSKYGSAYQMMLEGKAAQAGARQQKREGFECLLQY